MLTYNRSLNSTEVPVPSALTGTIQCWTIQLTESISSIPWKGWVKSAMRNLQEIINRLADGLIDIDAAVLEVQNMEHEPLAYGKIGPRDTFEQFMADPEGGARHDSAGSILAAAHGSNRIDEEQYAALAKALTG